jgi:CheY-like chemotaxis protein
MVKFSAPDINILVVDDINTNLKVTKGLLQPYDMQVDLCTSGIEAIETIKSKDYDLVFMDHKMPVMDGVETVRRIRAMGKDDPYYKHVPIVALTANAVAGTREMFLENEFNDFLSKPIDTVKLNDILEKWLLKNKHENKTKTVKNAENNDKAMKIEGVDIDKGIAMSGGTTELYFIVLAAFYEDGIEVIKKIENCIETGDLPLYTTLVHGIKSAAQIIGADEVSEIAKTLEEAGNRGDSAFIHAHNPKFLRLLETLVFNISNYIAR